MSRNHGFQAMAVAAVLVLRSATALPGQEVTLTGRAVDVQGAPMAGIEVLLHRVDAAGGASIGSAITDSAGGFSLTGPAGADTAAVYFAATRSEGELYIGPFVRADDLPPSYMLVVGGQPVPLGPAITTTALPPVSPGPGPRRLALVLLPLAGLLGFTAWWLSQVARPRARQRLLIRLATLDEEMATEGADPRLRRERDRILERLLAG